MPSPILARADALMQRRRQSPGESDDIPLLTDAIALPDDDIPVLTDFATPSVAPPPEPLPVTETPDSLDAPTATLSELPASPPSSQMSVMPEQLLTELARRVELRLTAELPRLIESTLHDLLAEKAMIDAQPRHD